MGGQWLPRPRERCVLVGFAFFPCGMSEVEGMEECVDRWEAGDEPVRDRWKTAAVIQAHLCGAGLAFRGGLGFPTVHLTGPLPIRTEHLHSPFRLQEGNVNLIENQVCNMLYRRKFSHSKTYFVQEEMLCAGNFSTGKAICQVSFPSLRACLPQFPWRACVASGLFVETRGPGLACLLDVHGALYPTPPLETPRLRTPLSWTPGSTPSPLSLPATIACL